MPTTFVSSYILLNYQLNNSLEAVYISGLILASLLILWANVYLYLFLSKGPVWLNKNVVSTQILINEIVKNEKRPSFENYFN